MKTAVSASLEIDPNIISEADGAQLSLEVTVVTLRADASSPHEYYYSAFPLVVSKMSGEVGGEVGDAEPTASPSDGDDGGEETTSDASRVYAYGKLLIGGSAMALAVMY